MIHLTTTDPVAPIDLPAWCRMTGHLYLGPVPGPERPTYAVQVSGRPVPTQPNAPGGLPDDRQPRPSGRQARTCRGYGISITLWVAGVKGAGASASTSAASGLCSGYERSCGVA